MVLNVYLLYKCVGVVRISCLLLYHSHSTRINLQLQVKQETSQNEMATNFKVGIKFRPLLDIDRGKKVQWIVEEGHLKSADGRDLVFGKKF
jgi:hypothetical protein